MEENKKYRYLFCCLVMLLCGRHTLQLLGFSSIASIMFKMLYIVAFLTLVVCFWDKIKCGTINSTNSMLLLVTLCVAFIFFVLLLKFPSKLEASATLLITLPLLLCLSVFKITRKEAKLYYICLIPIAIILVASIFFGSGYENGVLVLYTGNSNQSGLLYMSVFMGIFIYQFLNKINFLMVFLEIGVLYGCWLTQSRTAFFACLFLVALSVLLYFVPKLRKPVLILVFVAMIVAPFLIDVMTRFLDKDLVIMGTSIFTGREKIWPTILKNIFSSINSPFTFNVDKMAYPNEFGKELGAHHVMLDIAWKYSVPVAVVFLAALVSVGRSAFAYFEDKKSSVVVACMVAALLHMTMEASIIGGALDYSLYFILNILCALSMLHPKEEKVSE